MNTTEKRCTDTNVRALESFNEYAALQCVFIANGEPPYADPHVRWCGRSENKSRKKTYFCFPPTRFKFHILNMLPCTLFVKLVAHLHLLADVVVKPHKAGIAAFGLSCGACFVLPNFVYFGSAAQKKIIVVAPLPKSKVSVSRLPYRHKKSRIRQLV